MQKVFDNSKTKEILKQIKCCTTLDELKAIETVFY